MRKPPEELERFLDAYSPGIAKLLLAARRKVLKVAPDANELIYDAYNTVTVAYSFSDRLKEAFCHTAAYSGHVNFGFNRGAELPDPSGILQGRGARIRHVRIQAVADLDAPPLVTLLHAAVAEGRELVPTAADTKASSTVRRTTGKKRRP